MATTTWPRTAGLLRGLVDPAARATSVALVAICMVCTGVIATCLLVLDSAQHSGRDVGRVPPGTVVISAAPFVRAGSHEAGDEVSLSGTPVLDPALVRDIEAVPGRTSLTVHRVSSGIGAGSVWVHTDDPRRFARGVAALVRTESTSGPFAAVVSVRGPGQRLPAVPDLEAQSLIGLASVMTAVLIGVGLLTLAGTSAFAISRRTQGLALLRLTGATPSQVLRHLVGEAALIGATAVTLAVPTGYSLLSPVLAGLRAGGLADATTTPVRAGWPAVVAGLTGFVLPVLAVVLTGRRVVRLSPTAALREADVPTRRPGWVRRTAGAAITAASLALVAVVGHVGIDKAPNVAFAVDVLMLGGVALLGPDVVRLSAVPMVALWSRLGAVPYVAGRAWRHQPFRSSALAQPVMLAVSLGGVLLSVSTMVAASQDHLAAQRAGAGEISGSGSVTQDTSRVVRAVPGVRSAVLIQPSRLIAVEPEDVGLFEWRAATLDQPPGAALRLHVVAGDTAHLGPGRSILSDAMANDLKLHVGDRLTGWGPDGLRSRTRVVAIVSGTDGFADVMLSPTDLPDAADASGVSPATLAIDAPASVLTGPLTAALHATPAGKGLQVHRTSTEVRRRPDELAQANTRSVWVLVGSIFALAGASLLVTASIDIASRGREISQLRSSGATGAQMLATLRMEGGAAALTGGLLGAAVCTGALALLAHALPGHPSVPGEQVASCAALCASIGGVVFSLPTLRLSRQGHLERAA